jgi:uncharacterized damage-inducible protein DinB
MDAQALLKDVAQMPLLEMERFVQAVNGLITQKKTTDKSYRERFLLQKINETVLGKEKTERYKLLVQKLEAETLTDAEYTEFMQLADNEEKIRYERLTYLVELAQLKSITLPELMDKMGLNRPAHA